MLDWRKVWKRIIEDNIRYAKEYGACDTVISATDTIVESQDGKIISAIPERSKMYQGQTPQSFNARELKELYESLTDAEKEILTDAAKILVMKGRPVHLAEGEVFNIYKLEDFFNTTILEGVQIKSVTNGNEIYIDINKSIIDGIKNNENNTENTIVSINEEDLNTLILYHILHN